MKTNRKVIMKNLKNAIQPIIGENGNKDIDKLVQKSTRKLSDLIAEFMVKTEKKRKKLKVK
ncbi:MAG: hypothetical protein LCH67_19570 [Bacteroidetes bacterium]|nr:hypothetical protein [Bacteroidota bacterium]